MGRSADLKIKTSFEAPSTTGRADTRRLTMPRPVQLTDLPTGSSLDVENPPVFQKHLGEPEQAPSCT